MRKEDYLQSFDKIIDQLEEIREKLITDEIDFHLSDIIYSAVGFMIWLCELIKLIINDIGKHLPLSEYFFLMKSLNKCIERFSDEEK